MSFTFKTIQATYPGAGAGSRVLFALSQAMNDSAGTQIEAVTRTMYLDELTGAGSIILPANDDASTNPPGTYYIVTERINPGPERVYWITINAAATSPIQLATIPHASGGTVTYGIASLTSADASVTITTPAPGVRDLSVVGGGGGGSAHIIEDEGTPLTARAKLNFIGAGVTATDNPGANSTDVTIPVVGVTSVTGTPPIASSGGATPAISIAAATTGAVGAVQLATPSSDVTAGHVVQASDARLSDARAPTGAAGGDLTGNFPAPALAAAGTAGTYAYPASVTTDSKGRVTAATAGSAPKQEYGREAGFTANGTARFIMLGAQTLDIANAIVDGTATVTYWKALLATPSTYTQITTSTGFVTGDRFEIRATGVSGTVAVAVPRSA